ncbi:hypothetical protein FOCC_FOCC003789 [Frankliniella occidentalis]|nr:hypothetical protein FOCC_FOCC003789 [Frankliniella occidentalis]
MTAPYSLPFHFLDSWPRGPRPLPAAAGALQAGVSPRRPARVPPPPSFAPLFQPFLASVLGTWANIGDPVCVKMLSNVAAPISLGFCVSGENYLHVLRRNPIFWMREDLKIIFMYQTHILLLFFVNK